MQDYSNSDIICLLGRIGSGKTTFANKLIQEQRYTKISMADSMRELLWKILDYVPTDELEYQLFKNLHLSLFQTWDNKQFNNVGHLVTGRQLLQNIGESCKGIFGQEIWVKEWVSRVEKKMNRKDIECGVFDHGVSIDGDNPTLPLLQSKSPPRIVCDDMRFPIEVIAAHKLGATFIWCDYNKGNYNKDTHPSESLSDDILNSKRYKHLDEIPFQEILHFTNKSIN